MIIFIHHKCSG